MKLIALLLGLVLERLATDLLHLRELRWFDPYFDFGLKRSAHAAAWLRYLIVAALLLLPMIPVLWLSLWLQRAGFPWDLPYVIFAVLVVFFCLGPRDLVSEVDEYCQALDSGDTERARRVLVELSEVERLRANEIEVVEDAIFIQATNRIFGVVFWFVVLGPVGAWLFRLSDLLRRRAAFESARTAPGQRHVLDTVEVVHSVLVYVPARLAALGYALGGSYDDALNAWRNFRASGTMPAHRTNDEVVARVGKAAMTGFLEEPENSSAAARNASRLVTRTLFIWVTVIALMTIFGWAV
jgi:AmpE protein